MEELPIAVHLRVALFLRLLLAPELRDYAAGDRVGLSALGFLGLAGWAVMAVGR